MDRASVALDIFARGIAARLARWRARSASGFTPRRSSGWCRSGARRANHLSAARRQGGRRSRDMAHRARLGRCRGFGPCRRSAVRASTSPRAGRTVTRRRPRQARWRSRIEADGAAGLPRSSGLADDLFVHDGQITKRPMRALALSALAPRPGEKLVGHRRRFRIDLGRMGARRRSGDRDRGAGGSRRQYSRQCRGLRPRAQDHASSRELRLTALSISRKARRSLHRRRPRCGDVRRGLVADRCRHAHRRAQRDPGDRGAAVRPAASSTAATSCGSRFRMPRRSAATGPGRPLASRRAMERGEMTVHFIGAGPGAPDLLTLRGRDLIASCPVCLYAGSLVPKEILAHCPPGARIVNTAPLSLDEIIAEIASAHAAGKDVARLHSGDLSVWSAMGEQLRRLRALGIPYSVTPGVPSFAAAAAALEAELTLPGLAQSVVLTRTSGPRQRDAGRRDARRFRRDRRGAGDPSFGPCARQGHCRAHAALWRGLSRSRWSGARAGPTSASSARRSARSKSSLGAELERTAIILVGRTIEREGFRRKPPLRRRL